jgi:hypothetical protein
VGALGAALLGATRPKQASASAFVYTSADGTATLEADNTDSGFGLLGTSSGINAGVGGLASGASASGVYGKAAASDGYGVNGANTGGGVGVYGSSSTGGYGILGNSNGVGVFGYGAGTGVAGNSSSAGTGVYGEVSGGLGIGVSGVNLSNGYGVSGVSNGGTGVYGESSGSPGFGVYGLGDRGATGVYGKSNGGNGVYGTNNTPAGGQPAVLGVNSGPGPGVVGFSGGGTGLAGGTGSGTGLSGIASGSGNGVVGQSAAGNGVTGIATGAGNLAGLFQGPVWITGGLAVQGAKNAVVRGTDGSLQRLYSLECPESWFEDFGSGQLSSGSAMVQLEPGFAGVAKTDAYHIFLTANGDSNGLYVSNKTVTSFTVHEQHGGTSGISFSYRVVAKRKDIEGVRLEQVEEPPTVQPLKLPELLANTSTPPAPTAPPVPGQGR